MGSLTIKKTGFNGLYIIKSNPHYDDRGAFGRLFCKEELRQANIEFDIVQINYSFSKLQGTTRGLHFQHPPFCEDKIVRCLRGKVLDIVVDIRKDSSTFLQCLTIELSKENNLSLLIPKGFAHGFQTLEDNTELLYLHSQYYNKKYEGGLNISDPVLSIQLPLSIKEISQRDKEFSYINSSFQGIEI